MAFTLALGFAVGCSKPKADPKGDTASSDAPKAGGCARDTDCKGDRVCVSGVCQESANGAPAAVAKKEGSKAAIGDAPAKAPDAVPGGLMVNPPSNFNRGVVRVAPSPTAAQVASLDRGTALTSNESSADGQWKKVRWTVNGGGEGWMHRDVVSVPGAAAKAGRGSCARESQNCLLDDGVTAGVCMNFNGLVCATPTEITHFDGCKSRKQACRCGNTGRAGRCDLGTLKEGLYCQCD